MTVTIIEFIIVIAAILLGARYGGLGLPILVNQYVVKGDGDDV